jgi:UDP-2,4-diacetamido-2,4,6-trideoxy-beta-L-altropyranose hydrolase
MNVAFRVDASSVIGLGHLKRCLSLAKTLRNLGSNCFFLCSDLGFNCCAIVESEGFACTVLPTLAYPQSTRDKIHADAGWHADAHHSLAALAPIAPDWVVVDHYGLDRGWHETIRNEARCRIAVIDDLADRDLDCDLLLDQNHDDDHTRKYSGRHQGKTICLFGPHYALLDPVYAHAAKYQFSPDVRSIGIFMGGMDARNVSGRIIEALDMAGYDGPVEIVTTSGNPALPKLKAQALRRTNTDILVDLPNLAGFFARHDLQIGAGGSSTWERCCIGAPAMLIPFVENHNIVLDSLAKLKVATAVPWGWETGSLAEKIGEAYADSNCRRLQSKQGMALVDGEGAVRVALAILRDKLRLRPATANDCRQAFNWRNAPNVRDVSHNREPIEWESHVRWFSKMLSGSSRRLFVAIVGDRDVGHIRLDSGDDGEEVSFYLDPRLNGLGLGSRMLAAVEQYVLMGLIVGTVVDGNDASHRLFEKTGYNRTCDNRWEKRLNHKQRKYS